MTKADLITEMVRDGLVSKESAKEIVNSFMQIVSDKLATGEKVTINGFGTFLNVAAGNRYRRNPKSGETIFVPGYNTISFRPGKHLKDKIGSEENE